MRQDAGRQDTLHTAGRGRGGGWAGGDETGRRKGVDRDSSRNTDGAGSLSQTRICQSVS